MSDFEQSFQQLVDSAVERAILKYIDSLRDIIKKDRLLSVSELSQYSGFSKSTIKNWIHRSYDPLPAYQIDKDYRIFLPAFITWIKNYKIGHKERKKKMINTKESR